MRKNKAKTGMVVGLFPHQYKIEDHRLTKPICYQKIENGEIAGSLLFQEIETAKVDKQTITYFCPNNIAILLSISSKVLNQAQILYKEFFENTEICLEVEKTNEDRKLFLNRISKNTCDYIEYIQSSIVFGYTALETFANLSIPDNYEYQTINKSKGTKEIYDKDAIERWLTLKIKFQHILKDIYKTKKLESQQWWSDFCSLEQYRNDIIHQKSIKSTDFYKNYFHKNIFRICKVPIVLVRFFYSSHADQNKTNPIWPWLVNEQNIFPLAEYNQNNFEVIGNVFEGWEK